MGKHARPSLEPSGNEGKKKLKLASNAEDSAPTTKPVADGRQDEGSDQDEEGDEGAQSGEELEEESEEDEDDQEDEDEDEEEHNGNGVKDDRFAAFPEDEAEEPSLSNDDDDEAPIRRVIDPSSLTSLSSKTDRSGILYLPRIPPGMGPGKVKHLLSQWGKVGRIYLAREEEPNVTGRDGTGKKGKKRKHEKHRKHDFKEGWVEMEDKKVARRMAELLNARPIGGKPSSPFAHDLWSLTYLPRFKWSHLSDQIAYERQSRQHALRRGLEQSRREQEWYLEMVERARVEGKMEEKEEARREKRKEKGEAGEKNAKPGKEKKKKVYKQREAMGDGAPKPKTSKSTGDLSAVLNGLL